MLFPSISESAMQRAIDEVWDAATSSDEEIQFDDTRDRVREIKKKTKAKRTFDKNFFDADSEKILASGVGEDEANDGANSRPSGDFTFNELNLSRPILKAVFEAGFLRPTPIQRACIPVALAGRDVCACSATGTGKTAAFMLPILERLLFRPKGRRSVTRVLVLVPTRELAIQVFQVSQKLAQFNQINMCLCAGGLDVKTQEAALRLCPDIVIATPGRLIDHLQNSPNFSLADVEVLVLDEADRMLDEAFGAQMKELIRLCSRKRQTMLFSATMTDEIENLAQMSLSKPVRLFVNENTDVASNLNQEFIRLRDGHEDDREALVAALITRTFTSHTIVFVATKHACRRLALILSFLGVNVGELHGNLKQAKRVDALARFKAQQIDVLCSTDLAARGLDVEGVLTVINMHMPTELKRYIHRVGRTARAGNVGRAISLVGDKDRATLKEIMKLHNNSRPLKQRTIDPEIIRSLNDQIAELEPKIACALNEQHFENQLEKTEVALTKAERKLKANEDGGAQLVERVWKLGDSDAKVAKQKERKAKQKEKSRKEQKAEEARMNPEELSQCREVAFLARQAKRAKRPRRMRVVRDDMAPMPRSGTGRKFRKRASLFSEESQFAKAPKRRRRT